MIRAGIQYRKGMQTELLSERQFDYMELLYEDAAEDAPAEVQVSGIVAAVKGLTAERLERAVELAERCQASYLLLDTRDIRTEGNTAHGDGAPEAEDGVSEARILDLLERHSQILKTAGLKIYIENGYDQDEQGRISAGFFSEIQNLREFVRKVDHMTGRACSGVCLNIGYANLLGKNIRGMAEALGADIRMVHVNDNDGRSDQRQLPYTFTAGRGDLTTDWYHIIGALARIGFDGWMIFDTSGTFERMPSGLLGPVLDLLRDILTEWKEQLQLESLLNQPGRRLILFGAGNMLSDFLKAWGDKVTPYFVVDNNPALWGSRRFDLEIHPPEDILKLPPEERNVWICNQFYDQIGGQLKGMGIAYHCYYDHYYIVTDPKGGLVM